MQKTVDKAAKSLGGLDSVCNTAGIGHFANSHEETPEWFDRIVSVNLNGTFYVPRYALPHLLRSYEETGVDGVIVNTASTSGLMGAPWSAAYCASKGGVVNLTRALAYEYRGKGVRVNAIAPGGTNTNIVTSFMNLPENADYKLMGKIMTPMDQADIKPRMMTTILAGHPICFHIERTSKPTSCRSISPKIFNLTIIQSHSS